MSCQRFSANFSTNFLGRENVFAADANTPQIKPQICRIYHRKYCRIPALNRKATEPRNSPNMTRAMAPKHRRAAAFLLRFSTSMESIDV